MKIITYLISKGDKKIADGVVSNDVDRSRHLPIKADTRNYCSHCFQKNKKRGYIHLEGGKNIFYKDFILCPLNDESTNKFKAHKLYFQWCDIMKIEFSDCHIILECRKYNASALRRLVLLKISKNERTCDDGHRIRLIINKGATVQFRDFKKSFINKKLN